MAAAGRARRALGWPMACALALSACGGGSPAPPATTVGSTGPPPTATTSTTVGKAFVPNVVGKDLATARAQLAAAGFTQINPHDGTQRGRPPADTWIVYSQSPPAEGSGALLTTVVVSLELLQKGERYVPPGTSPCPPFVRC